MNEKVHILVAGLETGVVRAIAEQLKDGTVGHASQMLELSDALSAARVNLLLIGDGLDGLRPADVLARLQESRLPQPERVWCCIGASTGEYIAHLAEAGFQRIFFLPVNADEIARELGRALGIPCSEPEIAEAPSGASALAVVWAKFRDATLARVDILESAALHLLGGNLPADNRREAEREAHKLAGSAGTFGFPQGSRIARELERQFGSSTLKAEDAVELSESIIQLRSILEGAPESHTGDITPTRLKQVLLLVSDDRNFSDRVAMEAQGRGYDIITAPSAEAARREAVAAGLTAAIVELPASGGQNDALNFVRELDSRIPSVPAVVISGAQDFSLRLEVARHGARIFLEKPVSPSRLLEVVAAQIDKFSGTRGTLVAVDDDVRILHAMRALLEPVGMRFVPVNDPLQFWQVLEDTNPDLLLLDIDMPIVSGFEICRALRQDSRWGRIPILFVTARDDAQSVQRAFSAGADDYIRKPIVPGELLMRISSHLNRARSNRELAETDPLTGIANRRKASELIDRLVRLARRSGEPLSLAVLDVDQFKQVNDSHGHAVGDEVLRGLAHFLTQSLRAEDVVGRWGGDEFVIASYGTTKSETANRLRDVIAAFASHKFSASDSNGALTVSCSAGVAQFPADGSEADAVRAKADAALYHAKQGGRNRVSMSQAADLRETSVIDIAIIDDDESLTALLAHAMETQRFSSLTFHNADTALESLTGSPPAIFARVILLDVDLPGMSGIDVLRVLGREGVTARSRVVMLSARTGESDILTALELGAADHVTKPFSLPVLMQKIRVALRTSQGD